MPEKIIFEPFYRLLKGKEDLFNFFNTKLLGPPKGLEGFLCPGINILGNIYNIKTHLLEPQIKDLTFEWLSKCDFFPQGVSTRLRFLSLLEPPSSAFWHKAALDAVPFWEDWEMRQGSLSTNALVLFMNRVVDGTSNVQPHSNKHSWPFKN